MKSKQVIATVLDALGAIVVDGQGVQVKQDFADAPQDAHDLSAPVLIPEVSQETILETPHPLSLQGFKARCTRTAYIQGFIKVPFGATPSDPLDDLTEQVRLSILTIPRSIFLSVSESQCQFILPDQGSNFARVSLAYEIVYINQIGG